MRSHRFSIRLFRLFGIDVYVNWTWLLVAVIMVQVQSSGKDALPLATSAALYLGLFTIVLLHEFGHALACKSVGGRAEQIVLWPLGGVAYVDPPMRPAAVLWSLAAGPLVNVALIPVTLVLLSLAYFLTGPFYLLTDQGSPWTQLALLLTIVNGSILLFNLLPIYPLDGGQILQTLIWFVAGRSMSLLIVSIIGLVGAAALIAFSLPASGYWLAIMGMFLLFQSWNGLRYARHLRRLEAAPRHYHFACPWCRQAPPALFLWPCPACGVRFDFFADPGHCPKCSRSYHVAPCPYCNHQFPLPLWTANPIPQPNPLPDPILVPPVITPQPDALSATNHDSVSKSDTPQ